MRVAHLGRVLISGIDIVDHDMASWPARALRIASVIGHAIDHPSARLHAALLGDAQNRLVGMSCQVGDQWGNGTQGNHDDGSIGLSHHEPPFLRSLTPPESNWTSIPLYDQRSRVL